MTQQSESKLGISSASLEQPLLARASGGQSTGEISSKQTSDKGLCQHHLVRNNHIRNVHQQVWSCNIQYTCSVLSNNCLITHR